MSNKINSSQSKQNNRQSFKLKDQEALELFKLHLKFEQKFTSLDSSETSIIY